MRRLALALAATALSVAPAVADQADAQRQALWEKMAGTPTLMKVDQIIIEGDGSDPLIRGWLEKRDWVSSAPTVYYKRFTAKFERKCRIEAPACYEVTGIWSQGELIAD